MPRADQRIFDKTQPVYVRKTLKVSGKILYPGAYFDWKNLAVTDRQVRNMFANGMLHHEIHEDEEIQKDPDLVVQEDDFEEPVINKQEIEESESLTDDKEEKTSGYTTSHRGGPWYDVIGPDGEKVNEAALRQSDAVALVEKLTDEFSGNTETI